jgi:hypothetical protein
MKRPSGDQLIGTVVRPELWTSCSLPEPSTAVM